MAERVNNNFQIVRTPDAVYKLANSGNTSMLDRLRREAAAYEIVGDHQPDLIPAATLTEIHGVGTALKIGYVNNLGKRFPFAVYRDVIERLQEMPQEYTLPTLQTAN